MFCVLFLQAGKKAEEMAEMQRMKEVAHLQQELNQKKGLEDALKRQALTTSVMPDTEMARELDKLRKLSLKQGEELQR